jgi:hypothetical protein
MSEQNLQEQTEEQKKLLRMKMIYGAIEQGWSVKKADNDSKTFEFTKNKSLEEDYKGLVIFAKNTNSNICEDIQKHLENLKKIDKKTDKKHERSISTPIVKNKEA